MGSVFAPEEDVKVEPKKKEAVVTQEKPAVEETPAPPVEKTYGIGEAVKVGKFEYVINGAKETKELKSDNQFIDSVTTTGILLVVSYTVKNLDIKARMVDSNLFQIKGQNLTL
ncbi:DUF4352 domain-containing protein [Bacillus sp. OV166]|uniref:DUF4352 domain-containing protein n=1 Tax=Bacillus sp. OV166 TaxID=1882763 RepID=UPI0015C51325|nr:DUF4352 domain-containing protein [Bacillus sp. OV166]